MAKVLRSLIRRTLLAGKGNLVSLDDPYETMTRLLRGRDVRSILDAGASDGRISRRLLRRFPDATAHLFEPNPAYADVLNALAAADSRYQVQLVALSDHEGTMDLHVTEAPGPSSLFRPTEQALSTWGAQAQVREIRQVPVTTVDQWVEREQIGPIQIMKLDIQGGETAALRGAGRVLRDDVLLVYTEVFFNRMYEDASVFGEIDLLIRDSGFVLYNIFKPKSDDGGRLIQADAIYIHGERMTG